LKGFSNREEAEIIVAEHNERGDRVAPQCPYQEPIRV
jgi:hypothetical protein